MVPADRCFVHRGVEGVPGGQQWQDAATDHSGVGEDADAAALGETTRPATYGCQAQAAGIVNLADDGADGVQMRGDGAVWAIAPTLEGGANGAAAGQFEGNPQLRQTLGDIAHDGIGEAGGAGDGEHLQQYLLQVREVGFGEFLHIGSPCENCLGGLRSAINSAPGLRCACPGYG